MLFRRLGIRVCTGCVGPLSAMETCPTHVYMPLTVSYDGTKRCDICVRSAPRDAHESQPQMCRKHKIQLVECVYIESMDDDVEVQYARQECSQCECARDRRIARAAKLLADFLTPPTSPVDHLSN